LLLTCLIALAGELRDVCNLVRSDGIWRIAALQRLVALRFCFFAACFVAPSHCLPQGSGQGIVATQTIPLEGGKIAAMAALGH
jgi:hypothetical protein